MSPERHDDPVRVEFQRGGCDRIETRHRGAIAVVDGSGRLRWRAGDPRRAYALGSTAKPFQLLPLLLDGLHTGEDDAAVIVDVPRQLGGVTRDDVDLWRALDEISALTERNDRGLEIGTYHPVFHLEEA